MRSRKVATSKRLLPPTRGPQLVLPTGLNGIDNVLCVGLCLLILAHLHLGVKEPLPLQIIAYIAPAFVEQIFIHGVLFVDRDVELSLARLNDMPSARMSTTGPRSTLKM